MLVFLKVALAVAASLFGVYQVADKLDLHTHLTLGGFDHAQHYLAFVGLGPVNRSSALNTNAVPINASNVPGSVILGDNNAASSATDLSSLPVDTPVVPLAHTPSAQHHPSRRNAGPRLDEGAAFSSQFLFEKMATLNSAVDYLFSFVEVPPTSVWGFVQFSLAAVFIIGFVFVLGATCYWALRLVDLRGHIASITPKLLPIGPETVLPASESKDCDVPSIILDIVQSVLAKTPPPENSSSFIQAMTMEGLAFATEIAQVHSDAMKNESVSLRNEMKKVVEAHLNSKLDRLHNVDSKADASFIFEFQNKVDKIRATSDTVRKETASSISAQNTSLSNVSKDLSRFQSNLQKLEKNLNKQSSENSRLARILEEERKAHEVQVSKVTEGADERLAKIMDEFKDMKDIMAQKVDKNTCIRLEGKIASLKSSSESRFGKLQTNLETSREDLVLDTKNVHAKLEKQLADLNDTKDQLGSKVDAAGTKIEEQQGNIEQMKKTLASKGETKAFRELQNQLNGFVKNRQLGDLKHQIDTISSQVDTISSQAKNKADSSTVATLSKQLVDKVATDTFVAFKNQTKNELSTISKNLDTKVAMENLGEVKEAFVATQSELKSIIDQLPAMVAIEEFNGLRELLKVAQAELESCQAQLFAKATKEDFAQLEENIGKTQSDFRSVAERLHKKANIADLNGLEMTIENVQSGLTALENKLPVIEGVDFGKIADDIDFFKGQKEGIRRLVEDKVHDSAFAELESRVDLMADKPSLAKLQTNIDEKMADIWKAFAERVVKVECATKPSTEAGHYQEQKESQPFETSTGTPVASSCKTLDSDPSVMSHPAEKSAPKTPSVSGQQYTATNTSQNVTPPTTAAQVIPKEPEPESQKTTRDSSCTQTQRTDPQGSSQPVQNLDSAPLSSGNSTVNAVSRPSDQERSSNIYIPAIRINPAAAAKGAAALMQSRFAPSERPPLADKTNVTRSNGSGTAKAVESASGPWNSVSGTKSSSGLAGSEWASPQQGQQSAPPGGLADSKWAPPQQAQRSAPSRGLADSKWAPQNQRPAPLSGLEDSKWASPQPGQRRAPLGGLADSKWAPQNQLKSQCSAPSAGLADSKWASPQPAEPCSSTTEEIRGSSNRNFSGPQLTLQDPSLTPAGEMQHTTLPSSGLAPAPSQVEPSFGSGQPARSILVANDLSAVPLGPKTPLVPLYAPGNGPGPNGGQRRLTKNTKSHNAIQRDRNSLNKALKRFTPAQQNHARQFQDPVTFLFSRGSPWSWLNPIFTQGKRSWQVQPPPGWTVPIPPLTPPPPSSNLIGSYH